MSDFLFIKFTEVTSFPSGLFIVNSSDFIDFHCLIPPWALKTIDKGSGNLDLTSIWEFSTLLDISVDFCLQERKAKNAKHTSMCFII
ncbi:hypothetical protein GCM10023163_06380 [Aestuariibaculum suncheonense]